MAAKMSDEEEFAATLRSIRDLIPYEAGNYPYVTARVKAKKAYLYPPDTYAKMLQMEIPQISRFLGEGVYKEEILALGARARGVDLIERATADNLAKVFTQIIGMGEGVLRDMIAIYLDRWDVVNIKTILRGKLYGATAAEVLEDLVPAGSLDAAFLRSLVEKETIDDVFEALGGTIYAEAKREVGAGFDPTRDLAAYEDALSHVYFRHLLATIQPRTDAARLFLEFVRREIDILNVKTLLRVWKAKAKFEHSIFLEGGLELDSEDLSAMVGLDLNGILSGLERYSLREGIGPAIRDVEHAGVANLERTLEKLHRREASRYSHIHPLSVLPVLDFIASKMREVENIRIIARGKEHGIPSERIKELLVT